MEHQFIQQSQIVGTDHKDPEGNRESDVSQKQQHVLGGEHANASSGDVMVTGSSCQPSYVPISKQPLSPPLTSTTSAVTGNSKGHTARVEDAGVEKPLQLSALVGFPAATISVTGELGTDPCDNMNESNTLQYQQDEQAPSNDVELSTVDSSSHSHLLPSKPSHYSSIPSTSEHKVSDQETTNTATTLLPYNKRRADHERIEKRRRTVHCLLHGIEKVCAHVYTFMCLVHNIGTRTVVYGKLFLPVTLINLLL